MLRKSGKFLRRKWNCDDNRYFPDFIVHCLREQCRNAAHRSGTAEQGKHRSVMQGIGGEADQGIGTAAS